MSVSDNSTLLVQRDNESSFPMLDGQSYGVGDLSVNSYEKSPYIDTEMICLDVGPTQTRYRVHRAILSQCPELEAKPEMKLWGEKMNTIITLPELDETTMHTFVHFLYTGRYQTLQSYAQAEKGAIHRYKLGTCVYCAAIKFKLAGLAELAKEKITACGEDLTIFEILSVARENAFPLLPDDELWFPAYLEDAVKGAVAEDPELFMKPGFVDQIEGDRRYRQVVIKAMLNTRVGTVGSPQPVSVQSTTVASSQPASVKSPIVEALTNESAEAVVDKEQPEVVLVQTSKPNGVASPSKETVEATAAAISESVKLDDIEPTLASPEAPEPFTDELGFGSSKTYQKMGRKPEEDVKQEGSVGNRVEATPTPAPAHTRTDSVMQVEQSIPAVAKAPKKAVGGAVPADAKTQQKTAIGAAAVPAVAKAQEKAAAGVGAASSESMVSPPVIVDGTNGNTGLSKKAKKKLKKTAALNASS